MLNVETGDCIAEAQRRSVRHGYDFDWLGGHFVNQEVRRSVDGAHGCSAPP